MKRHCSSRRPATFGSHKTSSHCDLGTRASGNGKDVMKFLQRLILRPHLSRAPGLILISSQGCCFTVWRQRRRLTRSHSLTPNLRPVLTLCDQPTANAHSHKGTYAKRGMVLLFYMEGSFWCISHILLTLSRIRILPNVWNPKTLLPSMPINKIFVCIYLCCMKPSKDIRLLVHVIPLQKSC